MNNYAGYKKLVSKVLDVNESDILPLKNIDLAIIDRTIQVAGNRYYRVLSGRFGLFGVRQTLRKIAEGFEVTPERIRQLEARALTKLRHPSRIKNFELFTKTGLEKQERVEETPLLERKVEDFELSVRTLNGVRSAGVGTLGELARKTEREMIKIRGFGRKSLAELKNLLQSLGLDFAH